MIVTTGKIIKIQVGHLTLERSCEAPGAVRVTSDISIGSLSLPVESNGSERFIEAYKRILSEDIPYRTMGAE